MRIKKASSHSSLAGPFVRGALKLDLSLLRAHVGPSKNASPLPLTTKEFKILATLAQNEDKVYSRQDLVKSVWGEGVHIQERTVDCHIFGLRKKLGDYSDYIECIPSAGYRFVNIAGTI